MIDTVHSVDDVRVFPSKGPWKTKSGGFLTQRFQFAWPELLAGYFAYRAGAPEKLSVDIRGLRIYTVESIAKGSIGALELHKVRYEIVFVTSGSLRWTNEDIAGGRREDVLTVKEVMWIPPSIFHTYEALEEATGLLVVANTLFDPDRPATQDSFGRAEFESLKQSSR